MNLQCAIGGHQVAWERREDGRFYVLDHCSRCGGRIRPEERAAAKARRQEQLATHQHAWILAGTCTFDGCEARLTSARCDECGGSGNSGCCTDPAHRHMASCGRCRGVGVITVVQQVER